MNFLRFSTLIELIKAFPTEQSCIAYLEQIRWRGNVVSPFDAESKVYKCKDGKYRCKNTDRQFTVKTQSIFSGTHIPLQKWIITIYLFSCNRNGVSSYELASNIGVSQKTAWFMLHRLREGASKGFFWDVPMDGIIEADEAFIGGKRRNKHLRKKLFYSHADKAVVFGMVKRGGESRLFHLPNKGTKRIQKIIAKHVAPQAFLFTDEGTAYAGLKDKYRHETVVHGKHEYVRGLVYTNTIENVWSRVKKTIKGTYSFTSKRLLQRYLNEFSFRYDWRNENVYERFEALVRRVFVPRLTYKRLLSLETFQ